MEDIKSQSAITTHFKALLAFAKKPQYISSTGTFSEKLKSFCVLFFLNLIMVSLLMGLLSFVETFLPESVLEDHKVSQMFNDSPTWVIFLMAAVVAPLWEELMFRFPLYYRRWVINVLAGILLLSGAGMIIGLETLVLQIAVGAVLLAILVLYIVFNERVLEYTRKLWENRFPFVFYTFTALFAIIHISNYNMSWQVLLLFPILVLPQFAIGIFLGYVRVRFGIAWSIAFHAVHNGFFVGLATLAMLMVFTPIDVTKEDYTLKVNKSESDSFDATSKIGKDSIAITNHKFRTCLSLLTDKDEKFIDVDEDKAGVKLDILFVNKGEKNATESTIKNNKKLILDEMQEAYGFTFDTLSKSIPYYELYVKDNAKLEKYKSNSKKTSTTTIGFDKVTIENSPVREMVSALNEKNTGVQFISGIGNDQLYSFSYPVLSLPETEQYFEKHFGLGFKKSKKEIEEIKVNFEY